MRVFAVVDGIHLWVSVPFNILYPVRSSSSAEVRRQAVERHAQARCQHTGDCGLITFIKFTELEKWRAPARKAVCHLEVSPSVC